MTAGKGKLDSHNENTLASYPNHQVPLLLSSGEPIEGIWY